MSEIKLPCLGLNRHADKRLEELHPWVFSNEIAETERFGRLEPGTMLDILNRHGDYVGTGFANPNSLIAIRFLSRNREEVIDQKFFEQKIGQAIRLREIVYGPKTHARSTYRAVFGESDGVPGLVIDRYGPVWVIQPFALGISVRMTMVVDALKAVATGICGAEAIGAIVLRSDARSSLQEKIPETREILFGAIPKSGVWAEEGGVKFPVDPMEGQKTGFFFDQRENRQAFVRWVKALKEKNPDKKVRVADIYCHLGGWGLEALVAGADHATFIDQSETALASVKAAAEKLGLAERCEFICGDAVTEMKKIAPKSFQAVALDPPAFITSKKTVPQGLKAYLQNNGTAVKLVSDGGILSTSSCSYHCEELRFEETVGLAVRTNDRDGQILWRGNAAWDHPALPGVAETRYLKNLLLRIQR